LGIFDLSGSTAVVIGGTSGIGRAISFGLAAEGADVVPTSRRLELVEETAGEIERQSGGECLRVATDANCAGSVDALVAAVIARFGHIDVLVNCQGVTRMRPVLEMEESEWNEVLATNLTSVFRACRAFGREMLRAGGGRIVNIASLGSYQSFPGVSAYCVSKAGVAMLTKALACEWAPHINVNAIAPGIFRTPLNSELLDRPDRGPRLLKRIPAGRFGNLDELVGAAVYLASGASRYTTGQILAVDGGFLASGL